MRFTPKTDAEIAQANLLPAGEYDYEVVSAAEKTSKTGNDMIELRLRIFAGESERSLTDYLLEAMPAKLKHFCDSHGMSQHYTNGTLHARDCEMLMGRCKVGVEKDRAGKYPDKNRVIDYVVGRTVSASANGVPTFPDTGVSDGDIPF